MTVCLEVYHSAMILAALLRIHSSRALYEQREKEHELAGFLRVFVASANAMAVRLGVLFLQCDCCESSNVFVECVGHGRMKPMPPLWC